jgi:hypothetical protein
MAYVTRKILCSRTGGSLAAFQSQTAQSGRQPAEEENGAACSCARFRRLDPRHAVPVAGLASPPALFSQFRHQSRILNGDGLMGKFRNNATCLAVKDRTSWR